MAMGSKAQRGDTMAYVAMDFTAGGTGLVHVAGGPLGLQPLVLVHKSWLLGLSC